MTISLERSAAHDDPAALVGRRAAGHSLEAPFYASQEIFDLDMRAIWAQHWLFVAAEAELPEPGDFVTVDVGPTSVILVRDDDEEVRAFHNVCRHRGSRILDDKAGCVGNLVCPYHHWTYGVDGGLMAPYELGRAKVAHQVDIIEQGNWKLVMENNRECYHCDGHPELLTAYFPLHGYTAEDVPPRLRRVWDRFEKAGADLAAACVRQNFPRDAIRELDTRPTGFFIGHAPLDGAGKSYTAGGESVCAKRMGSIADDRFGDLHLHTTPRTARSSRAPSGVWRTRATGPARTRRSRATSTPSSPGTSRASVPTCPARDRRRSSLS